MILREIKNIYVKNRLTEGVDFKRYEWLKGDGRAYIDTGITDLSVSEYIKFEMDDSNDPAVRCMGCERNTQEGCGRLCFGWQGDSSSGGGTIYMWSDTGTWGANNNRRKWTLDLINNAAYTGSLSKTTGLVFPQKVQSFVLFGSRDSSGNVNIRSQCTMWSFEVHNQINLIPCQLIHAIPATLDANNIARQAGECGMYDSITGKFYGNVSSKGTFTVEGEVEPETHTGLQQIYQNRLIEGVDYETADWLKMDIPESIIIDMMSLPINSNNVEFKRNWIQITNSEYFRTSNYIYYITDYGDMHDLHPMVWSITPSQIRYIGNINLGLGLHTIITNSNGVTISANSKVASLSWYGNQIVYMKFNSMMIFNTKTIHLTSSIKVDGVIRYVPCTLLHSIPRNLDAQCKERVAGDCGMVDLISGKFYGNVANSGTFTVENNTENNE